jgi:hypothetical protein
VSHADSRSFTAAERLAAILALLECVNTGPWANIATDKSLNARAAQLAASSNIALGGSAYFTPKPSQFLRPWYGRHFGTYTPQ